MTPDAQINHAFEASWPAAESVDHGAMRSGRGLGAGGRVSSTRPLTADWTVDDIAAAEAQHRAWDQTPMFRLSDGDASLQDALLQRGYHASTPTAVMAADCAALIGDVPQLTTFTIWPPLAIQCDIWTEGNINASRQAVMQRVDLPKTAILGRLDDRAVAAAFAVQAGPVAMIHAIEVLPEFRRRGLAGWIIRTAAQWAQEQGATRLGLAVSRGNTAARTAYDRLGFTEIDGYSYWSRE